MAALPPSTSATPSLNVNPNPFELCWIPFQELSSKLTHLNFEAEQKNSVVKIKELLSDSAFLGFLMEEKPRELISSFGRILYAPGEEEYEILDLLFSHPQFPVFFKNNNQNMPTSLQENCQYFLDFQTDYAHLQPERLCKIAYFFTRAYYFDRVNQILRERCADLTPLYLRAIMKGHSLKNLEPDIILKTIIPQIASEKSLEAAHCLSDLMHKTRKDLPEVSRFIFSEWQHLTPYPMMGPSSNWQISSEVIGEMSPQQIMENLHSLIMLRNWEEATLFKGEISRLDPEDLGRLLMFIAAVDAEKLDKTFTEHKPQEELITQILNSEQASKIPQPYLRQALAGFSQWIILNEKPTEETVRSREAPVNCTFINKVCQLLKQRIAKPLS